MSMAYFDNAATTYPKPEIVYSTINEFYRQYGVNVGRGQYKAASVASRLVDDTREKTQSVLNAGTKQVVFTPSATIALNMILQGIEYNDGAYIYISPFEHNAVTRVLEHLQKKHNLIIKTLPWSRDTGKFDIEMLRAMFIKNTPSLVVMNHASNVCGLICPVDDISRLAKEFGAVTVLDMSQTAGIIPIELRSELFDFAVFAGHKTLYSPFGAAGIVTAKGNSLTPVLFGGTGIDSSNPEMPDFLPARLEPGSINIAAIAGLNASLGWMLEIGLDQMRCREKENKKMLLDVLSHHRNFTLIGSYNTPSIGVVSCTHKTLSPDNIGSLLSNMDIAVRTGLHCSPHSHIILGTYPSGTIRFSVGYFNNQDDFYRLDKALQFIDRNV